MSVKRGGSAAKIGKFPRWRGRLFAPRGTYSEAEATSARILFETFESRVLLDAVLPVHLANNASTANGTVLASDSQPAIVQNAAGTNVSVSIAGNGHWQIVQQAVAPTLTITGTDANSVVSIATTGGTNRFLFSGIDVEGPAASLTGTGVDLSGGLTLKGAIANLFLGDVALDATTTPSLGANSATALATLTVGASTPSSLTLGGGALLSTGASIVADQSAAQGASASVSGAGTQWQVNGGLTVGNAATGAQLSLNGQGALVADSLDVGAQKTGGGTVTVSDAGTDLAVSGTATFGDQGSGALVVEAGADVTLGNAVFGNIAGSVGTVTLSGTGSLLNVPGELTLGGSGRAVMTLGAGTSLLVGTLNIGPNGVITSGGAQIGNYTATVAPALAAGLTTFASGTATNGVTANPSVSGTVAAVNTLVSLRAGLGSTAAASYTDITGSISAGAFTISQAMLSALNGGALPDGRYVLTLVATDRLGIQSTATVNITLETAAPTITNFGLTQSSALGGTGNTTAAALVALTGTTTPGATVALTGAASLTTLAGANGVFQFANVPVAPGANTFSVTATNGVGTTAQAQATVTRQGTASLDVAMQWNQVTLNTISGLALQAPDASRLLAIVSLAQYDTLAAIEGTPAYLVTESVTGPVNEQAALAQTAYEVLVDLFPVFKATYDAALATSLAGIAAGAGLTNGTALGTSIADTIVAIRKTDGSANFVQDDGGSAPGQWAPTLPANQPAIDPQWGSVTPFAISSADALVTQIGPPPALTSAQWATDLNQVESIGSATSTTRTADQTQIALFWAGSTGTVSPAGLWNIIAQTVAQAQGTSLSANVRMFATLNTALADAAIADWDVKYTYGMWRPIQAVPVANTVNSAATSAANWTPLLITPAFPEYASGHSTFSSAAATVLASIFGDATSFSFSVPYLAGVTRSFTSFSQAAAEAGMSRIYGGIHFMFSNTAGQTLGALVGNQVIARFKQSTDTTAPTVIANPTPAVAAANITITGQITDNLSGVAAATVSVDGGAKAALALDAKGDFSFTTSFRLEGNDDGAHVISIVATDNAGNVAQAFTRNFVLDTQAPVLTLTSPNNGDALSASSALVGTVSGTGSAIVALGYTVDGGVANPISFDPTTGAFNQALAMGNLSIGSHNLVLKTQDAAGNTASVTRSVSVTAMAAFTLSNFTPSSGATDVGATFRPEIFFSRPVNPATLTAASFYATDSAGNAVAATIAPSQDGSYAFLLFTNPLPGLSTITLNVVGALIRAAADGAYLDAAGTGATSGSTLASSFTTVSTSGVAGTVIKGIVADPGPDLTPGTADDVGRGPDGILNTADDVYKLPIANVKVTVLGTSLVTYTDASGNFEIDNAPAGDVKLVLDGTTATNPPAGFYFPEMTLDLTIQPGVVNTPMGAMGTTAQQSANAGVLGVYLPRVANAVLTTVSTTQPTTITTTQTASPNLTADQVSGLSLTVAPGSAVDANGNPVSNVQIGIQTVPAQLVQDMLPAGVTQHTFDITIQAPGVAVFTQAASITFPNVFGAAPGTKLQVLSFDHTTGRLVIDGTATVSADGQTVVSDPGQGVTAPGWHGLVPPGTQGSGSVSTPCGTQGSAAAQAADQAASNAKVAAIAAIAKVTNTDLSTTHDALESLRRTEAANISSISQAVYDGKIPANVANLAAKVDSALGPALEVTGKIFNWTNVASDLYSLYNDYNNPNTTGLQWTYDSLKLGIDGVLAFNPELGAGVKALQLGVGIFTAAIKDIPEDTENAKMKLEKNEAAEQAAEQALEKAGEWTPTSNQDLQIANYFKAANSDLQSLEGATNAIEQASTDFTNDFSTVEDFIDNFDPSQADGGYQLSIYQQDVGELNKLINDADTLQNDTDPTILANQVFADASQIDAAIDTQLFMPVSSTASAGTMVVGNTIFASLQDSGGNVQRFTFAPSTGFSRVMAPNTQYTLTVFDPTTLSTGQIIFQSAQSGSPTAIPYVPLVSQTDFPSDGGLDTLAAFAVGVNPNNASNLVPGVTDVTALQDGLGQAKVAAEQTGVVSGVALNGAAEAVTVQESASLSTQLTAYVATGGAGLAVVDVSSTTSPTVLAQLNLTGTNVDVAVDPTTNIAAVAGSNAGLHLVDVSTPTTPKLLTDIAFPNPVIAAAAGNGVAYVAEGTAVAMVDLATETVLTTLDLSTSGGTTLTGLALSGTTLVTMDAAHTLRAITITGNVLAARGSITLSAGSGKVTIGGTVAYVPAANGNASGGYQTVDLSNLDALKLIEGVDGASIADAEMALNGSGLAIGIQSLQQPPPNPGVQNDLDVINVASPNKTGNFVTRITLPQAAYGLTIANGLAFVADGTGGLQIVNYLGLDTKGVPPTVSINTDAIDADPNTAGTQVVEGSVINVTPTVTDDVQVRNVELLVNGKIVSNDPSYPFNFSVQVPTIASGGSTMTIQALAFDTGGNSTLSNLVTLNVVKDTFPPTVASTSIAQNASLYYVNSVQVTFNKPLDTSKLVAAGVSLVAAGPDGVFGTSDDVTYPVTVTSRSFGQVVSFLFSQVLPAGSYQLTINASDVVDLSGNVLAAPIVLDFTVKPASNVKAASGVAAITQEPSANPGQLIGVTVPFDPSTAHMVFPTITSTGTQSTTDVAATQYNSSTGTAYFVVPTTAFTGTVSIYSLIAGAKTNYTAGAFPLEIVPLLTGSYVNSVSSDGTSANVTLVGAGFIPGNNSSYQFGSTTIVDKGTGSGVSVGNSGYVPTYTSYPNGFATLTVPLSAGAFGPISVTTAGGTSTVQSNSLTGIIAAALSGTPANAALPSANPGQAITLTGTGLGTTSAIFLTYTNSSGVLTTIQVSPSSATADGTSATLILPGYVNGIATLSWLGSSTKPTVQIVPMVSGYSDNGSTLSLYGSGFLEGAATYTLPGATVTDTAISSGPHVVYNYTIGVDNGQVNIPEVAHGQGNVTVTTAGGTSAPVTLNMFTPATGFLGDIAVNAAGLVWVSDGSNPTKLDLVDPTTGKISNTISLTSAFGNAYTGGYIGLQVLPSAMTLGTTAVPAGSLLVFNGYPNPNQVIAVNPTTGAVIASLKLVNNYQLAAGLYDPTSGHLFVIDERTSTTKLEEINPASGAEINSVSLPFSASNAGLAIDPTTGYFWYGSDQSNVVAELTRTGTVVRELTLSPQSDSASNVSGLSFDASGKLLVSTTQGTVYSINLGYNLAVSAPTLTAITATAQGGTPANAAVASANAGQVVTLTGSNFGASTEVVFPTLDSSGNVGTTAVTPQAISADGKTLQVQVPTLASTGAVQVVNVGSQNLGYGSNNDGIYRNVTLSFTPGASTAALTFADAGLPGLSTNSWGIDNVVVTQSGGTVFSDNFESGSAKSAWSVNQVDSADPGVFTDFLGRFSGGSATLNLTGLTAGQAVTLSFDLYIVDNWVGTSTNGGPDTFQVTTGGTTLLNAAFSNSTTTVQTYNGSATLPLQVVPTLTGLTGRPGSDATFSLAGSGFMDGASTVTIGGVALVDSFTNQAALGVTGTTNSAFNVTAPLTLDGPIKITTTGGSATLSSAALGTQPPVQFTGISATATQGTAANATTASAIAGQTITLNGQGFTSATLVQFAAADASNTVGTVTLTGTANAAGTTLSVTVPLLAKTGLVRVLGSSASYTLQIVPVLRSVGGSVVAGNTVELGGTGLVGGELVITVDGHAVGNFAVRDVYDTNPTTAGADQQILTFTVPAGVGAGVITVSTNGGTSTLHTGTAIGSSSLTPSADVGDTIATAQALTVPVDSQVSVSAKTGDGGFGQLDVDMYQVSLAAGDVLSIGVNSTTYSVLRLLNAAGTQLATGGTYVSPSTTTPVLSFVAPTAGLYYLGVSGYNNASYDPTKAGSGTAATYTGAYTLQVARLGEADARLTGLTATASSGTPALADVASANIGQTITLAGVGLLASDQVSFTAIDSNGNVTSDVVKPLTVTGTSLTVVVPNDATTGGVTLVGDTAGILLQIVPTLTHVDVGVGSAFTGGTMTLTGSGFAEGTSIVHFGTQTLVDTSRSTGIDVYYGTVAGVSTPNAQITLTTPAGVASGPLTVSTLGGTSAVYPLSVTGITATASAGTPANAGQASANAGQAITITGAGLDTSTDVVFPTVNSAGVAGQIVVHPSVATADGSAATVVVPATAVTGIVRVVGDRNAAQMVLQIVPIVTGIYVNSVASDGTSANVTLSGSGFIEGAGSRYQFGAGVVVDGSTSSGPDVADYGYAPAYTNVQNGFVTLTLPLNASAYGPISVTTSGGSASLLNLSLTGITATALSGTPANAALPSANAGQAITLTGTGLSTNAALFLTYTTSNGVLNTIKVSPSSATADGTAATLILPGYLNGIATLSWLGASTKLTLQIVPVVSGYSDNGSTLSLSGSGFLEGAATYTMPGATVTDTSVSSGPDVVYGSTVDNGQVNIPEVAHGSGNVTVTTAGGTSAPATLNMFNPATSTGFLGDIAVNAVGLVWVSDNSNPTKLDLVDPTTGKISNTISLTSAFGGTYTGGYIGLQVLGTAMTLGTTPVPAGSLLVFNGNPNPDQVTAVNPATGAVIASLKLVNNYDLTAGFYDPTSGHLFVIDRRASTTKLQEINPANGAEISSFALPFNTSANAGLAIDPTTGYFWYGSDQSNVLAELTRTGTLVRELALSQQSDSGSNVSGLSFDATGKLLVATTQGTVYSINLGYNLAVAAPTLTAINATAQAGTPASAAVASANAGQVITLTGSNFGPGTEVVFPTLDSSGNTGSTAVTPLAISTDGKTLQVQVPTLASTGGLQVVNVGSQNLGYGGTNDAIYRGITLSFTPTASSAAIIFADAGLAGVNSNSWGLDNVVLAQGGTTLFSDNFEGGTAKSQWSVTTVDTTDQGAFSDFLGRFSGGTATLNLTGLTAGQAVTLTFDLYIIDNWVGTNTSGGPDLFKVSTGGTTLFSAAFSNSTSNVQTYNGSAAIPLQVVPTLTSLTGRPGSDATFSLAGSGFMDGASTVTIGGVALVDNYANQTALGVTGTTNSAFNVTAPLTLDGPIKITTAGGSATLAGPVFAAQPPVLFNGITASAAAGVAASATTASANAGQAITLNGQGFTSSTLVQFTGADGSGTTGTVTVTGTANTAGTTLTVIVPELAKTGPVQVLGSSAAYTLQVVPLLRAVGGTVVAGNTIELEGTGLVLNELNVQIDGHAVSNLKLTNVLDSNPNGTTTRDGQQLLTFTVPAGIGAGIITVTTNGGNTTLHTGITVNASSLTPASDVGDTLATAQVLTLPADSQVSVTAKLGDGSFGALDVDLYQVSLAAGEVLSVGLNATTYAQLRLFNATGSQLAANSGSYVSPNTSGPVLSFTAPTAGVYYVGVSAYPNSAYNPAVGGSGVTSSYSGNDTITLKSLGSADTRLTGIAGTASAGTPAQSGVASANIGQTITLTGTGIANTDQVVFTAIDANGNLTTDSVKPTSVAANGNSLTVVVPNDATTGAVELTGDTAGILLQVVPTLTHVGVSAGGALTGATMTLLGTGFAEGSATVHFGTQSLSDTSRSTGLDVYYGTVAGASTPNAQITLTTPNGIQTGPISISTAGGTSAADPLAVTGLTAKAASGTPPNAAQASANAGQSITLNGTGLDTTTDVVFPTINSAGVIGQVIVQPTAAATNGTTATVVVPSNATTGFVRVVGDANASQNLLQVVLAA